MNEDYIYSKIHEAKAAIDSARKEHDFIVEKIKRLKTAYEQIEKIKQSLKRNVIKKDTELINNRYLWKGSKYGSSGGFKRSYKRLGVDLAESNRKYYRSVDNIHDKINREINRLEIKKKGLLNLIWQQDAIISTLRTELANLTN